MALVVKDRVKVTTTTTGTGTITLGAAASGFQSFAVIGNANQTYYTIVGGSEWEVGIGTYTSSGTTLSRDTVLDSSNAGNKVNFSAGSKDVFVVYPAGRSVMTDFEQTISNKTVITTTQTALQYATSNLPSIKPTLLLDFANTEQLDPRITFTRASEGRYYDGKTFAKAEENLFLYSQEFDNAYWSTTRATISANSTTAPDGTTTADSLTQTTGQTVSGIVQQSNNPSNIAGAYVFSVFAKPNGKNFIRVIFVDVTAGNIFRECYFNVSTGAIGTASNGAVGTITASANGYYRCSIAYTFASAGTISLRLALADTDNSATVTDSGGVFIWGAQLEQRSSVTAYTATTTQPITNYIPVLMTAANGVARFGHNPVTEESLGLLIEEQRSNLLVRSAEFDNASWTKFRGSITANTIVSPDGGLTGDKFVEDTTASNTHGLFQTQSISSGQAYTYSVFAKAAERTWVLLGLDVTGTEIKSWFNLSTGVTGTVGAGATATITSVGNGWYRCAVTVTSSTTSATAVIKTATGNLNESYTGDGYSGIYIWGAQLEAGSVATSYIPTVAAQVTRSADAASMTGTNFSSWFSNDQGTLYIEINPLALAASSGVVINDNTTNNRIRLATASTTDQGTVTTSGVAQAVLDGGTPVVNTNMKLAMTYQVNNFALSLNGATAATDTVGTVPVVNQLQIGAETTTIGNLRIKKLAYYTAALTTTQLQALTS